MPSALPGIEFAEIHQATSLHRVPSQTTDMRSRGLTMNPMNAEEGENKNDGVGREGGANNNDDTASWNEAALMQFKIERMRKMFGEDAPEWWLSFSSFILGQRPGRAALRETVRDTITTSVREEEGRRERNSSSSGAAWYAPSGLWYLSVRALMVLNVIYSPYFMATSYSGAVVWFCFNFPIMLSAVAALCAVWSHIPRMVRTRSHVRCMHAACYLSPHLVSPVALVCWFINNQVRRGHC